MADFTFLKGNIETIILCCLYNGEKYGYEIAREIKERTEDKYEIKQPTLYAYLKRLEQQELIESYWGTESNGGRRRYYKLTNKGKQSCTEFMSEWEYHQRVLNSLTNIDENAVEEKSQSDVTPLFGSKQKKQRKNKLEDGDIFSTQSEIASRLDALNDDEQTKASEFYNESNDGQNAETSVATTTATPVPVQQCEDVSTAPTDQQGKQQSTQAPVEDFMNLFDQRAKEASELVKDAQVGENYQRVLMGVLGEQLDDMQNFENSEKQAKSGIKTPEFVAGEQVQLEDVADELSKQGIRMRIYNRTTAGYKSKNLMPISKVNCSTAWITYAIEIALLALLSVFAISTNSYLTYIVVAGILLIVPIVFSIIAMADTSRKNKPEFNFSYTFVITLIISIAVLLVSVAVNLFAHIELSNFVNVSKRILLPFVISLVLPFGVLVYNGFYKKY